MSKKTKIWLIIATCLMLVGGIIFGSVMTVFKWDFTKLSTNKYETKDYEINENFSSISINTDTADITFLVSKDNKCYVSCYQQKNTPYLVEVKDETLLIDEVNKRKWYEYIGINFRAPKIAVSLPDTLYTELFIKESTGDIEIPNAFKFIRADISLSTGDIEFFANAEHIKIKTSTGNICVENITAKDLELSASTGHITVSNVNCDGDVNISVSTGKTKLTNINCKNLTSTASTGDLYLNNVIALEKFSVKRDTGNVRIDSSDGGEIFIETDTGDVTGSLLTEKVFITNTDTGNINVPKTVKGGKCEITTDTGDIKISIIN